MVTFWVITIPLGFINTIYPRFLVAYLVSQAKLKLDFVNPRDQLGGSEVTDLDSNGYIRRSLAAHNNGWEAMNMWTAAVLTAAVRGVDLETINTVAAIWLVARLLYNPAYIIATSTASSYFRSVLFIVTLLCGQYLLWSAFSE